MAPVTTILISAPYHQRLSTIPRRQAGSISKGESKQYIITDQNQLILGQANGSNLKVVLTANALDVTNGKGYYVVHLRGQGLYLDGTVSRYSSDPTTGIARLTLVLIDQQGNSASTYVEQQLTWASSNQGQGSSSGSNPFGSG